MSEVFAGEEFVPIVRMSTELGKKLNPGDVLDFDYDAYASLMRNMGASSVKHEENPLRIEFRTSANLPITFGGGYLPVETIQFPWVLMPFRNTSKRNVKNTNSVLVHEIQHYVDDLKGGYDTNVQPDIVRYIKHCSVSGITAGITATGSLVTNEKALACVAIPAALYGLGAIALLHKNYTFQKHEISARKAQRKFNDVNLLSIVSAETN